VGGRFQLVHSEATVVEAESAKQTCRYGALQRLKGPLSQQEPPQLAPQGKGSATPEHEGPGKG
jgi:hypothetical protein